MTRPVLQVLNSAMNFFLIFESISIVKTCVKNLILNRFEKSVKFQPIINKY
jgi:hypothetical protein